MLIDTIRADMVAAMKAKNEITLRTVRSIIGAVQEAEVSGAQATTLTDDEVLKVIAAQAKRRVEAAEAFEDAGRADQAQAERDEYDVLAAYLPAALEGPALVALVESLLAAGDFTDKAQMGQAMKAVNAEVAGRADGREVANLVKARLS